MLAVENCKLVRYVSQTPGKQIKKKQLVNNALLVNKVLPDKTILYRLKKLGVHCTLSCYVLKAIEGKNK